MKVHVRIFDIVIVLVFLGVISAAFFFGFRKKSGKAMLVVETPSGKYIYPLDKNEHLEFKGRMGTTYVSIQDGDAFVTDSVCDNKTCVQMGRLRYQNDWAACLPNGVMLRIENSGNNSNSDFDAFSR